MKGDRSNLERQFSRLFRSMSFVSRHPSLNGRGREGERLAEIYQQLGTLWGFLALQCDHSAGWRTAPERKRACKLCGTIEGTAEPWVLLPRSGNKIVGRKLFPDSGETFPNKKAATIVDDTVRFHGATLRVNVHNAYRSRPFGRGKLDVSIAADRIVRLREGEIECWLDTYLAELKLRPRKRGEPPPFGAFVSELPKRALKRLPILVEYDERGDLVSVTVFRPAAPKLRRKPLRRATAAAKREGRSP